MNTLMVAELKRRGNGGRCLGRRDRMGRRAGRGRALADRSRDRGTDWRGSVLRDGAGSLVVGGAAGGRGNDVPVDRERYLAAQCLAFFPSAGVMNSHAGPPESG